MAVLMPRIHDVLAYLSELQLENLTPKGRNMLIGRGTRQR
jgi:hypothetical protein